MKIQREVKIGVTLITAIAILVWGVNFLKGNNVFDAGDRYYGVYPRVDGLNEGSPVFFKGFKIGSVQEIAFHPSRNGDFLVTFSIKKELSLAANTMAQIYSLDLMGTKGVQFLAGTDTQMLVPGDTLNTNVMGDLKDQVSMEMLPLKDKTERLLVKLDTVLTDINKVFSEDNTKSLAYGIKDFRSFMENLESVSEKLNSSFEPNGHIGNSLSKMDSLSCALNNQKENFVEIMGNLAAFSHQLKALNMDALAIKLDSSLSAVNLMLNQTQQGKGSLGLLLSDNTLYLNMIDATANLDRLLADLRHNPKRYLHFSAIDLGRKLYLETDEQNAGEMGIVFKVQLKTSPVALDLKNKTLNDTLRVFEDFDGRNYIYSIGESASYNNIVKVKDQFVSQYPDSRIVALENGKPLKLKRALKKITSKK